jgi:2-methylaconitate cis-trans-isomerase PrpF
MAIVHIVLFQFKADAKAEDVKAVRINHPGGLLTVTAEPDADGDHSMFSRPARASWHLKTAAFTQQARLPTSSP